MRPLIAAEPMLRVPSPEIVAELNGVSPARELVVAKQMTKGSVSAERITLTSILSQRERRPLLRVGEGGDEGSVVKGRDDAFKFETSKRKFSKYMIEENYLEADAGK
jgi:hypothetical protein